MTHPIDMIDARLLHIAAPETPATVLAQWADPMKRACLKFGIDTVREVASFVSQAAHESGGFTRLEENLNYSTNRLCEVWPKRFTPSLAAECAYKPEKIANIVYADRMGNGPPQSGDGSRYRGRGIFQLTGKRNYAACALALQTDLRVMPEFLLTPDGAALSAAWFFHENGLDALAATPGVEDETRRLNGGVIGLNDRKARFDRVVAEMLARGA
jgi:putative chitinase